MNPPGFPFTFVSVDVLFPLNFYPPRRPPAGLKGLKWTKRNASASSSATGTVGVQGENAFGR
jgi:hypothetical protein